MNRKQVIAVVVAIIATVIVFKIPPYYDNGGIIGGTVYYPFSHPPADNIYVARNSWLLKVELSFLVISLATALIAARRSAHRRQQSTLVVGLCLESIFFAVNVRSFNIVLQPEFTFYLLNVLAIVLLVVVIIRGRGPNPNTNPDPSEYPV
jgi:hypothetical protein